MWGRRKSGAGLSRRANDSGAESCGLSTCSPAVNNVLGQAFVSEYYGGVSMSGLNPRITVEPGKMGAKPCIRGLRFTVYDLASYLASGMTEEEILKDFPYLEKEDFHAVYEFFASIPERMTVLEASR